jgi:hypothetical protein
MGLALVAWAGCSSKCGNGHAAGESFPSADGCNTCSCGADGTVACTTRACVDAGPTGSAGTSGAAGTSGGAGTSGASGNSGAAGTDAEACGFGASYTFRDDGGFRAGYDQSTLTQARTHSIDRVSLGTDAMLSCARAVPCASSTAVTVPAIGAAVSHADVQAALAKAPGMVYGTDSRPVDGTVWLFQRNDGKNFYVGGGNAVPAGLRALETLLRKLDGETLQAPECAALRARQ